MPRKYTKRKGGKKRNKKRNKKKKSIKKGGLGALNSRALHRRQGIADVSGRGGAPVETEQVDPDQERVFALYSQFYHAMADAREQVASRALPGAAAEDASRTHGSR